MCDCGNCGMVKKLGVAIIINLANGFTQKFLVFSSSDRGKWGLKLVVKLF